MTDFVLHKGLRWEMERFGDGPELLLAFHGFGNHGSDFRVFAPAVSGKYRVLSFTLPHHSRESGPETPVSLSPGELGEFIDSVVRKEGATDFSLMGYSLGGKIALQLVGLFPTRIGQVFLFAPDGIRNSLSNAFVTRSIIGRKVYARIIRNPAGLFRLVRYLEKLKVLNPKLAAFVRESLSTPAKPEMVWNVSMCFRDIRPDIHKVQQHINRNGIGVHLFFGRYDRIIPPAVGERFAKGLQQQDVLHVVEAGHNLYR